MNSPNACGHIAHILYETLVDTFPLDWLKHDWTLKEMENAFNSHQRKPPQIRILEQGLMFVLVRPNKSRLVFTLQSGLSDAMYFSDSSGEYYTEISWLDVENVAAQLYSIASSDEMRASTCDAFWDSSEQQKKSKYS